MSRKEKSRIDTAGGNGLGVNPFGGLDALASLPAALPAANETAAKKNAAGSESPRNVSGNESAKNAQTVAGGSAAAGGQGKGAAAASTPTGAKRFCGRIDIRREKSGRGGKVVTTISGEGLAALAEAEREALLRQLKNRFGCGGSREGASLEVQGNLVEQLTPVLTQMGWRVVRTGG